jgi:hypothetical protein
MLVVQRMCDSDKKCRIQIPPMTKHVPFGTLSSAIEPLSIGAGQCLPNLVQCGVRQIEAVDGIRQMYHLAVQNRSLCVEFLILVCQGC